MTEITRDSFADLERHRLSLEQNVIKLRASLQHWQAWEIEYEGMKEDLYKLQDDDNVNALEDLIEDADEPAFPGQKVLLSGPERRQLLLDERGRPREIQRVAGLISRRVNYVQQNIATIFKLLRAAEDKYAASQVLVQPEVRNEEGLPLMEIFEELDSDGNVISTSTSKPGSTAPQVVEALRKAGVPGLPTGEAASKAASEAEGFDVAVLDSRQIAEAYKSKSSGKESISDSLVSREPSTNLKDNLSPKSRKSVSFAADTKEEASSTASVLSEEASKKREKATAGSYRKGFESVAGNETSKATIQDEGDEEPFNPIIPSDESPEDAALRQEMIQYNMREVGAIVAELDLDEGDSNYSGDESGDSNIDSSSIEEEEDRFGRTNQRVLTDDYVAQMRKLQQRLKNVGPMAAQDGPANNKITNEHGKTNTISANAPLKGKPASTKGIRFANELDIQEAPTIGPESPRPVAVPLEKHDGPKPIHAPNVIERPFNDTSSTQPSEPDEFDPRFLRQEVATEFQRMRNRMIQQRGGFTAPEDDDDKAEIPLTEAEGGPKKMSKFKAARLGKISM